MTSPWKAVAAFFGAAVAGVVAAVAGRKSAPADLPPEPEAPKFDDVDREVDRKIAEKKDE